MPTSDAPAITVWASDRFADHTPPPELNLAHPERPDRIYAVNAALRTLPYRIVEPTTPADDATLQLVHPAAYLKHVARVCARGGYVDAGETFANAHSDTIARLAVGAGIEAADAVWDGRTRRAFVAARPPGHHALADRAMGFCLYATGSIVARHLRERRGAERVAILDFDVHHGNGTQAIFYDDPSVLTISIHEDPQSLWPGSGFEQERGTGRGEGACLNLPLPAGSGDEAYLARLREEALPAVREFAPDVLLVSAGFDAAAADPLAHLNWTDAAYAASGRALAALADELCGGRLVALLEGGYNLAALAGGVTAFLEGLTSGYGGLSNR